MSDTNLTTNDINELAAFAYPLHEAGVPKVQMDTVHAVGLIRLACEGHEAAATITALRKRVAELEGAVAEEREWLKKQVFALHEDTIEKYHAIGMRDLEGKEGAYARGRCAEAMRIAVAIRSGE